MVLLVGRINSQTVHTIIFANKEEPNRGADRTAEFNNMSEFCGEIADGLGYKYDLRRHSGSEFTSTMAEKEVSNLNVSDGDIVIFYYDGHGCNWDDDEWPHMAFLDKQYWESTLYNKIKASCQKAKFTIVIAGCCNMDSEGQRSGRGNRQYSAMDRKRLKELFSGFDGRISIKSSASRRGQYSYSITGGRDIGNVYGMNIRDAIRNAVSVSSDSQLTWETVMNAAAKGSYEDTSGSGFTSGPQQPQHLIEKFAIEQKPSLPTTPSTKPTTPSVGQTAEAAFKNINATVMRLKDGAYISVLASFDTHYMNDEGGKLVAYIDGKEVKAVEIGTHYIHNSFSNKVILIPVSNVLSLISSDDFNIKAGVYDYKQKKVIAYSKELDIHLK